MAGDFECPYCGYEMAGYDHFDGGMRNDTMSECQRETCGKRFLLERDFDVTYEAFKVEDEEGNADGR